MQPASANLLVIGDVHGHWRAADRRYLESGLHDLALFVGDLGDEDVELAREVAALRAQKIVILGNHDAWRSFTQRRATPQLRAILAALGDDHVAYGVREVPKGGISVVGARPFSWGGPDLRSPELYQELFGVVDAATSADRIYEAARSAQHRDLVILAHNGPTGLSAEPHDIYGKDFGRPGGDWGDADLELAIQRIVASGWRVPCVIAGHMHHRVARPRAALRSRFVRRGGTLYVNPAVVPRLRVSDSGAELAHYLRMRWSAGKLIELEEVWVDADGVVREVVAPRIDELR